MLEFGANEDLFVLSFELHVQHFQLLSIPEADRSRCNLMAVGLFKALAISFTDNACRRLGVRFT